MNVDSGVMRLQYICPVESRTILTSPKSMKIDEHTIYFYGNSEGLLDRLIIERPIKSENEKPTVTVQGNASRINIGGEREDYLKIINLIQQIESILTVYGMKKIHYDEIIRKWIPESKEEEKEIQITEVKWTSRENDPLMEFPQWILNFDISKFDRLSIPLAFRREGMISFQQKKYIIAFNNFYFIIEGLYGKGKRTNVEDVLISSEELIAYAGSVNTALQRMTDFDQRIQPLFEKMKIRVNPGGLIMLLVKYRHRLHHFWIEKKDWYGHPFNQEDFRTIAFIALVLTNTILDAEVKKIRDCELETHVS